MIFPIFLEFSPGAHALRYALPFPLDQEKKKRRKEKTSTKAIVQQCPTLCFLIETEEVKTAFG